jgi:hypothetical protein
MKNIFKKTILMGMTTGLLALPFIASAATNPFEDAKANTEDIGQEAGIGTGETDIITIAGSIINVVLGFLGMVLLFYFLYGGFKWMTSGGEEEGVKEAQTMIKNAVIGLVIVMASYALSTFVLDQLITVTT